MRIEIASRIMARTTLNIDDPILRDLKDLQKREEKPLGELASEILAEGLARRKKGKRGPGPFHWTAHPLKARVDVADKEALYRRLDERG
jgi:hypothetical protein